MLDFIDDNPGPAIALIVVIGLVAATANVVVLAWLGMLAAGALGFTWVGFATSFLVSLTVHIVAALIAT